MAVAVAVAAIYSEIEQCGRECIMTHHPPFLSVVDGILCASSNDEHGYNDHEGGPEIAKH